MSDGDSVFRVFVHLEYLSFGCGADSCNYLFAGGEGGGVCPSPVTEDGIAWFFLGDCFDTNF